MKRLLEQKELLVVDLPKIKEIIERERGGLQTEREREQFNHLLNAFGDPGTKEDLNLVFFMFAQDMSYSRPAILHARRAVEFSRGWR